MKRDEMLPPGFRFYPREEELITFYLKHKIESGTNRMLQQSIDRVIPQLHVYDFHPSVLPEYAADRCQGDLEQWFFFIPRQEKEARGGRPSRLTISGYWKATGSLSIVYSSSNRAIGMKRTMVYYNGRAPTGTKTKWKMNEYKGFKDESSNATRNPKVMEEFSLCRIYVKSNSLRSFDRRPPRVTINEQQLIQNCVHHATTSTHPSRSLMSERSTGLSDRSHDSSDDQAVNHHSQSMMESDDQLLWNWEELAKWF